ncbi:MAG: hypothetical protein B6243_10715 [Anaerolineaceae bacterium 4572_5.2]|nr:MAG: hypothetical protein B6243_10715 [Anaerolineaceae bacterium 4572_5.2]
MSATLPRMLPGSYEDLYERGMSYFKEGQYDEALPVFERLYARLSKLSDKIFKRRPDLRELQLLSTEALAVLLGRQKEFERAEGLIQELIQLTAPQPAEARWIQMSLFYKIDSGSEDFQTVMDELRAMAVMYPEDRWAWSMMGRLWLHQGNYAEAESNFNRAIEREGSFSDFLITQTALFTLYKDQQRFDEAEEAMKILWRDLDVPDAKHPYPLYKMYLQSGNFKRAEYWLKQEKNPLNANFYRGLLAQKQGDEDAARDFWQKAVAEDPSLFEDGHPGWANAAMRLETDPLFIVEKLESLTGDDDDPAAHTLLMLAIAHIRAGNLDAARRILADLNDDPMKTSLLWEPPLNAEDWQLFTELISSAETQEAFKEYFEQA